MSEQNENKPNLDRTKIMEMLMQDDKVLHRFEEQVEQTKSRVADAAKSSKAINDEYGNTLLSIGENNKTEQFTNYSFDNDTLNWMLWLALYNDSWVFRRAIDKPAQDEIRCGITLAGNTDKSKAYKLIDSQRSSFIELLSWGALFGGSIACIMFSNLKDEDYVKPRKQLIKQIRQAQKMRMYVVDRWYGVQPSTDTVTNMADIDFGKPKYYTVTLADGHTVKFHHSWVLRYEHRTAPKLVKNGMLQGWGYAEGAHIINEMTRDEKLKASVQSLIDKSLIEVVKMAGMRGVFMGASTENDEQLRKRLEMVNWARNFNSLTFLDKDDEYIQHTYAGLGGLSDLLEKNMWLISAALEMQGVLYGDLKGGFSADSMALERYDETINCRCESWVRPVYTKFIRIVYDVLGINEDVEFTFNSLLTKEHQEKQVDDLGRFVDLLSRLLQDGVLTTKQYAIALRNYASNGTIDFGLTDDVIDKLDEDELKEGFDFESQKVL